MKIDINCKIKAGRTNYEGTEKMARLFAFNLPDDTSAAKVMMFEDGWAKLLGDSDFGRPGNRNNTAVNLCCLLHAGGVEDCVDWFTAFDGFVDLPVMDFKETTDAILRVEPYLDAWGPEGMEDDALCYMV